MSVNEDGLLRLLDFGFSRDQATIALLSSEDKFDEALELLLHEGEEDLRVPPAPAPATATAAVPSIVASLTSKEEIKESEDELLFESSVREMLTPSHTGLRALTCKSSGKGGSSIYLKGPPAGISTHRLDLALAIKVSTDDMIYLEVECLTPVHNLALSGSSWSPLHANDNPELVTLAFEAGAKTVIGITIDRRRGTFSTSGSIGSDGTGTVNFILPCDSAGGFSAPGPSMLYRRGTFAF